VGEPSIAGVLRKYDDVLGRRSWRKDVIFLLKKKIKTRFTWVDDVVEI